jgi:RNA polymerase sigma-70 factor (ECF subfamily)
MQQLTNLIYTARCTDLAREQRHAAFGQLIDLFQAALYARALRVIKDPQLAQDVTQETLLTAYQQLPRLRQPEAFPAWLNQILRTHCNRLRRQQRLTTISIEAHELAEYEAVSADRHDPMAALVTSDIRENVLAAIASLPEHERIVVHLFYLQEFSLKEIAARLKLPLNTIKKRLQYARGRLRTQIAETAETGASRFQALAASLAACLPALRFGLAPLFPAPCPVLVTPPSVRTIIPHSYHERR